MTPEQLLLPAGATGRLAAGSRLRTDGRAGDVAGLGTTGALALAAVSGVVFATAFPPLSWSIAAWVALVPLLVACAALSPGRAAVAGMCWAATAAVGVAAFLPGMLSRYFGLAPAPSWLASLAIAGGLHGVFVSGWAAWVAWLVRRRAANPLLVAAGWVVCELARASGPLGAPWALVGYSQLRWTAVVQIADLAGAYGIGFLVAAVNAGAAALLVPALRGRRPLVDATLIVAALAGALLYGEWRLGQPFGDGPPVRVAIVQGGGSPAEPAERAARLARYVELTTFGVEPGTRLVVWPEYAIEPYLEEASHTRDLVLRTAAASGADLVLGGPHFAPSGWGIRYHNSVYLVRDGRLAGRYDKHRLVPFAEDDRLGWLGRKATHYTPGHGALVLPGSALRIGASLCVEAMYPDLFRRMVGEGAEVLVNLSNDAWFGRADSARQQLDIAALRAVETRRWLVRAAATGFSAVVDPHGRTLVQSGFGVHQVLDASVRASHARTPYQRSGDAFAWLAIAAVAAGTLRSSRRSKP